MIERVEIGSAPAGARVIPTLDLICRDGAVQGRISIHLMRFGRILPHFIRDQSLADAAHQLAIAAGIDGRTSFAKEVQSCWAVVEADQPRASEGRDGRTAQRPPASPRTSGAGYLKLWLCRAHRQRHMTALYGRNRDS